MRATALNTICTMTLTAILFVGVSAAAQDSNMEATAGCVEDVECMFRGQPALAQNDGVARLQRINIFSSNGRDPRTSQDRAAETARALAPIAMIQTNNEIQNGSGQSARGQATAFLVSPCFALTNRHAVFGTEANPDVNADHTVSVNLGAGTNGGFRYTIQATPVRWGNVGQDWALLQLKNCAGRGLGWMELSTAKSTDLEGAEVSMAGYPSDRSTANLSLQRQCKIHKRVVRNNEVTHDCSARAGSSGSPVFQMRNGRPVVVGFHAGANNEVDGILNDFSAEHANGAISLDFLDTNSDVKGLIDADIQSFGRPNPASAAPTSASASQTTAA